MKFLFISIFFVLTSYADNYRVGNGGHIVRCGNNYELLDFYEARGIHKEISITNSSFQSHLQKLIKKLKKRNNSVFISFLQNEVKRVLNGNFISFVKNAQISSTQDTGTLFIEDNCELIQAATHKNRPGLGEYEYFIDEEIWQKLPSNQRYALVLHEVLYTLLREVFGIKKTSRIRGLVAWIFSQNILSLPQDEIYQIFTQAGLLPRLLPVISAVPQKNIFIRQDINYEVRRGLFKKVQCTLKSFILEHELIPSYEASRIIYKKSLHVVSAKGKLAQNNLFCLKKYRFTRTGRSYSAQFKLNLSGRKEDKDIMTYKRIIKRIEAYPKVLKSGLIRYEKETWYINPFKKFILEDQSFEINDTIPAYIPYN